MWGSKTLNPTLARSCDPISVSRYCPLKSRRTWGSVSSTGLVDHAFQLLEKFRSCSYERYSVVQIHCIRKMFCWSNVARSDKMSFKNENDYEYSH